MTGHFVRERMTLTRNAGNNASDSIDNDARQLLLMFAPENAPTSLDIWPQRRAAWFFSEELQGGLNTPHG
jgi:hypothetical protein